VDLALGYLRTPARRAISEAICRSDPAVAGRVRVKQRGGVGESPSAEAVVRGFIAASIRAWSSADASALARFFGEQAEYRNGPLPTAIGRDAIIASLAEMMSMGGEVAVDLLTLVVDGPIVMTERIDYLTIDERTAGLRIAGVFEVHGQVITAWRDYFDATEFALQLSGD
jgi:limonene-1,2-epoxide hydrolase